MIKYEIDPKNMPNGFSVYGVLSDFTRMPEKVAEKVSKSVQEISRCAAGGRVRFRTNSSSVCIECEFEDTNINGGMDVLADGEYRGTLIVEGQGDHDIPRLKGTILLYDDYTIEKMRDITIFLSRTLVTKKLNIYLEEGSQVDAATPYKSSKPLVFYGSSITMGASSSAPSKAYTALVSEKLNLDHINLGFGGSALGEPEMAEYIAGLDMEAFIMDYQYNAPTNEHLRKTHGPFYETIRKSHPDLPILFVSAPDVDRRFIGSCKGRQIVMDTFHRALDNGDYMVDFVDGFYLFGNENREICTITDTVHPSLEGFRRMAEVITPRLDMLIARCKKLKNMKEEGSLPSDFPCNLS